MELRRRVVPTKRYEPELSDGERYMPSIRKPLFRPPYVDFNPHLPPAAFPTLDESTKTLSELDLGAELGGSCQHPSPLQSKPKAQNFQKPQPQPPSICPRATSFVAMKDHTWEAGTYPHNPIYFRSLAAMEAGLSQEEFEWNMHEMGTSDEDDERGQQKSAFIKVGQSQITLPNC